MYDANSPLADTFTILPGTFSGLKPAGGLAVSASICAASAEVDSARALAASPAEATRKTSRRETFVDRVERFCISFASVENRQLRKYHAAWSTANPRRPEFGLSPRVRQRAPGDGKPVAAQFSAPSLSRALGTAFAISFLSHAVSPACNTGEIANGTDQNENRVRHHPAQGPQLLEPRGRRVREQRWLDQRQARSGAGQRGDSNPRLPAARRVRCAQHPQPLA